MAMTEHRLDEEITPAMIKAGASVVCELFHEVIAYESGIATIAAIEVYQAMRRAYEDEAK